MMELEGWGYTRSCDKQCEAIQEIKEESVPVERY